MDNPSSRLPQGAIHRRPVRGIGRAVGRVVLLVMAFLAGPLVADDSSPNILLLNGTQPNSRFGDAIVSLGDINRDGLPDFAISEPRYRATPDAKTLGRIHIFLGHRGKRATVADLIVPGERVAGAGDVDGDGFADVLVVLPSQDPSNAVPSQLALFRGSPAGIEPTAAWMVPLPAGLMSVSGVGDLNGDGMSDFAVGHNSDPEARGEILVFLGNSNLSWTGPSWSHRGENPGDMFGDTIAGAGDVDRDGFGDLLVAAPRYSKPELHRGRAYLFAGSRGGPASSPVWTANYPLEPRKGVDGQTEQHFGRYLAAAGDVNGDGYADVLIPAVFAERNDPDEGLVFCYLGSKTGLPSRPSWIGEANRPHSGFGWSVSTLGDLDGDGCDEVLIGAKLFANGQREEGAAAIYFGSRSGLTKYPVWVFESSRSLDKAGSQVRGLGDIDGDGFRDFAVSSPGYHEPPGAEGQDLGRVRIFYGSARGFAGDSGLRFVKTWGQAADEEWLRLDGATQAVVLGVVVGTVFAAGVWAREAWRRRTIVLVEKKSFENRAQERARLARDLHDDLGAQLSRVTIISERVCRSAGDPLCLRTYSEEIRATAKELRTAMEQLLSGLRHGADTLVAFVELISRQASTFCSGTELQCYEDMPSRLPNVQVPPHLRRELSHCIREVLANALKHSRAKNLWIRVRWDSPLLSIEIEDDGVGFLPEAVRHGHGLRNMKERMDLAGGTLEIAPRSKDRTGTRIKLTVILRSEEANPARLPQDAARE